MENSHLITVLKTLSKKEARDLKKWLNSPVHNQREDVVLLFEYLLTGEHLADDKFLQKERVFSKIYPGEAFEDAKLRQSMHFLLKSLEEFLIYQELREDEVRSRMALSSVYRKRKLDKAFQKTIKSIETLQENAPYRDEQYLRNEYLLQLEKYTFQEGKKRTVKMNLQEMSDALDLTFLADKLRQSCLMLAHQAVYKAQYDIGFLNEVLAFIEKGDFLQHPAIAMYYYGYKAISDESGQDYFQSLRQEIQKHKNYFPHSELRDIYLMAINYCVARINLGHAEMRKELFELYRNGIEDKILIEQNELSRFTFRNIINLGTALKEFEWINSFIDEYQDYLALQHRENFVHFSRAKLHFAKREYKQAMRMLAQSDFDDILTNLYSKSMLIIMYFEEEEIDALESLLESMRTYMRRKEVLGTHKVIYSNLIKYTRKLIRINPYDKDEKNKLKEEIERTSPLPEKEWFLKQLERI
jgi:hypothetical protein